MVKYRRHHSDNPDTKYFLTYVTKNRFPFFDSMENIRIQHETWQDILRKAKTELFAHVFLPDHSHVVLRQGDRTFSESMRDFKRQMNWILLKNKGTLWQSRFWEHFIRDENDLIKHIDYIHYNPVRHNLVATPMDYAFSSFSDFVKGGVYPSDWCEVSDIAISGEPLQSENASDTNQKINNREPRNRRIRATE